jgi:hypothetical protein
MTKQRVDWNWYSNGKRVYYNLTREIKNADASTFEPLNHVWARDAARVFERDKDVRSVDRQTFQVLNELYAKDANTVFYTEGRIKDADAETFVALEADHECGLRSYAKDKNNVYHHVFTIGKPVVVREADPRSFRTVGRGYGIDDNSVFYETCRLKGADPATWHFLCGGCYSQDKQSVYCGTQMVPGADVGSFEVLPGLQFSRDAHKYFRQHEVITQEEYFRELQRHFIFTGSVAEGMVTDHEGRLIEGLHVSDATREQGIEFQIECDKTLFSPDLTIDEPPVAGKRLRMVQRFKSCVVSDWIGKNWIWFFQPLARPNAHRIAPILNWRDFSPINDLDRIAALVDECVTASAK